MLHSVLIGVAWWSMASPLSPWCTESSLCSQDGPRGLLPSGRALEFPNGGRRVMAFSWSAELSMLWHRQTFSSSMFFVLQCLILVVNAPHWFGAILVTREGTRVELLGEFPKSSIPMSRRYRI
ncbi:Uncharacterized protein Rs2_37558 [Raphanus sativus]|nr:Uncharacterized protein Rs2_37558 [Raphanus sativus]